MGKTGIAIAVGATLAIGASSALAAPGPDILTAGGAEARASMTAGVAHETVSGVNIFRGTPALLGGERAGRETRSSTETPAIEVNITNAGCSFRNIRRLRTQGFYSGVPYPSRRYAQGFYSGR